MFYSGLCFGTDDLEKSGDFYDKVFKTIGVIRHQTTENEVGYGKKGEDECFWIIKPFNKKKASQGNGTQMIITCLLYTSPSPRDAHESRMPSSA